MKKIITQFGLTLSIAFISACSNNTRTVKEDHPVIVEVTHPSLQDSTVVSVSGKLSSKNSAAISTRMMSFVEKVYVKAGDQVKAGQALIRLNANELLAKRQQAIAQISEAELATHNAQKDYQRYHTLHAQESVSDKELENMKLNKTSMEAKLKMARQGLKEVEAMLDYTTIKAPFSGTVTQKYIDEGSTTTPGIPLLVVEQNHEIEVSATIPESYISHVAIGDRVDVEIKAIKQKVQGTICELSPSASQNGGQYAMKVALENRNNPDLLAGMYVKVYLPYQDTENATSHNLLIDKKSLIHREQLTGVYIVNSDHKAILRWIRLGKSYNDQVEVLSGLNANERVIINAKGKLYNGKKVEIK